MFKIILAAIELIAGIILTILFVFALSITMSIFQVPAGSPFDVSREIALFAVLALGLLDVADFAAFYLTVRGEINNFSINGRA